jgi:hypothetical protein
MWEAAHGTQRFAASVVFDNRVHDATPTNAIIHLGIDPIHLYFLAIV